MKASKERYVVGHLLLQAFSLPPRCICLVSLTFCLWHRMVKFRHALPLQGISGVEDNLYKINKWCCFFIITHPRQFAVFTLEKKNLDGSVFNSTFCSVVRTQGFLKYHFSFTWSWFYTQGFFMTHSPGWCCLLEFPWQWLQGYQ